MAKYALIWTDTFARTARGFLKKHPDLTGVLGDVLKQLEIDPHVPRLKLHKLQGKHGDKYAVSLTYSYRIILLLQINRGQVVLLDIGSHDKVY